MLIFYNNVQHILQSNENNLKQYYAKGIFHEVQLEVRSGRNIFKRKLLVQPTSDAVGMTENIFLFSLQNRKF